MTNVVEFPCRERLKVETGWNLRGEPIYMLRLSGLEENGQRYSYIFEIHEYLSDAAEAAFYWERHGTPVDYSAVRP